MIWRLLFAVFLFVSSFTPAFGQNFLPIGVTSSAVNNNTIYGYCFQATTNFTICGLKVKYDNVSSPTNQRLFVVKFSTTPANYSLTPPLTPGTQIFPFLVTSPTAAQLCNITVSSGEFIGIYGYRESACKNYFSTLSSGTLTVNGFNMPLTRSGGVLTNGSCGTTPSFNGFFSEPGLPLGAIELYTNCCFTPTIGTISQPNCTSTTGSIILNGLPPGNWTLNCYANGNTTTPASTITGTGNSYTVSGLTAGSYVFSVINAGGCSSANTSSTTINPSITIPTASITNNTGNSILTCSQNAISLSAVGTGTYSWANGATSVGTGVNLSATSPGTYTLTVTASNGCTATATQVITQNIATPGASITSPYNQLNCTLTSFTLSATGSGSYSWSNGSTNLGSGSSITVASPGTYQLTVTGTNGCTSTANYSVTQFSGTTISVNSSNICSGQNTTLTATPGLTGGAYLWSPGGATTNSITVNPTSTTVYSVNYLINGCTSTGTGTVTVNPTPLVTVNNATICPGINTVLTASGTPTGGTYSWSPSGQTGASITVSPSSTTNYTVTYSLNGCTPGTASSIVTVQNSLDFVNIQSPVSSTICQGQTFTVYGQVFESGITNPTGQATGITAEFAYSTLNTDPSTWPSASWSSASYNPASATNPANDEYMGVIPALGSGTYYFAFRFTYNGCVSYGGASSTGGGFWNGTGNNNGTFIIIPYVTPTFNAVSAICAGSPLAALPTTSTNLISGTWSPALSNQQTTTYTFSPTSGQCINTTSLTVTVNPLPTAAITPPTTTELTCLTTSITLTATGGGSYLWSTGATSSSITTSSPGTFPVIVTGANGCSSTISQVITQNIIPPTAAILSPTTSVLTCGITSISLTATGGGTYSWSNGTAVVGTNATLSVTTPGTYTVTVTSSNGCTATATQIITQNNIIPTAAINAPTTSVLTCSTSSITLTATGGGTYSWSNGAAVIGTNTTLAVTTPGTYTVTVTSTNGCTATASQVITQSTTLPTAAINTPTTTVLTCATTSITLTASGGGSYSWSNGTAVVGTNATLSVTTPGTFTVTVTNSNGCTATASQVITQNIVAPTTSIISFANTTILDCYIDNITLAASGAGGWVSSSWSNGTTVITANNNINVNTPGTYTVTVTAANGCTASASQLITQSTSLPSVAILTPSTTVLTCTTTSINLNAFGGGSYSWSNGTTVVGTNATLAVTTPGTYTVTVTGTNGCSATASSIITQNITLPTAGINAPTASILSCTTPTIPLTATGGGTYSWSNGTAVVGTNAALSVTTPGSYTVTVTSANGCAATVNQVITQDILTPIAAITNNTNSTVLDCNTTQISLTGVGGTSASWSNGTTTVSSTANLTVSAAGTYTYTGTNANGCFDTESITITFTANTNPTFTQIPAICANGTFSLPTTSTNGVQGTWSPAPNYTTTTTYTFQPNTGLCANTATMSITVHPYPVVTLQNDTICAGGNTTLTANVNFAGGLYTWSPIVSTANAITVSPNNTTSYQVIYSLLGCSDTSVAEVFVNPIPSLSLTNYTICNGQNATILPNINLPGGTYLWSNGSTLDSLVISPSTNSIYSLIYTLNGCASPSASSTVTVNPVPTLGINNSTICFGNNTTLTAIPNLTGGTFYWGSPGVAGTASQTITPSNDTTLSVYYTLNGCSSPIVISSVTVNPLPIATFTSNVTQGCVPLMVNFIPDDLTNTDYSWTTSNSLASTSISPNLNFQNSGNFDVTLTTSLNGCVVTQTLTNLIQVDDYPIADFDASVLIFSEQNQLVQFENNSFGAATYLWEFGDGETSTDETPSHTFLHTDDGATIVLTAISLHGCTDTSMIEIPFDPGLVFYIPNSFTPDGDMNNQTFNPVISSGIDLYHYTMLIYDRWGEVIFESNDTNIGWDGSYGPSGIHCQAGSYTYEIIVKLPNIDQRKKYTGIVNLIR
ncbi:MAG: hypothetical protein RIS20_579 [Bacteroidota bacterium]